MDKKIEDKVRARITREVKAEVRPSYPRWVAYSEEYLAERAAFVATWEKMCEDGEEKGFLCWTNDYDGSHLVSVDSLGYYAGVTYEETDEVWERKQKAKIETRVKKELKAIQERLNKMAAEGV